MAITLIGNINMSANLTLASALDLASAQVPLSYKKSYDFTSGTGANQVNQIFHDQRTLAASDHEDLDLSGGLTNPLGVSITLTKLKALIIKAADGNTNDVVLSRTSSLGCVLFSAASDAIPIKPGGMLMIVAPNADGIAVAAGTADLITITNSSSGTAVTYDIIIVGVA